jgi:hypothetical protein
VFLQLVWAAVAASGGGDAGGEAVGDLAPGVALVVGVGDGFPELGVGFGGQAD